MTPTLILMIVADQLRADHVGFGGLPLRVTPHLDAIADAGMVFDRAHVTNPICMPSRATLATGRWPSAHGTRTNGVPLDPRAETVMTSLSREGWQTAAVGKLHLQPMGFPWAPPQLAEIMATKPAAIDATVRNALAASGRPTDWEEITRHAAEPITMPADYYGFGSVDLTTGHGDQASGNYAQWVRSQGFDVDRSCGWNNAQHRSANWSEVWTTELPTELSTSAYVADHAVAQIERAAESNAPTFVFASFPDPHHPFCPPVDYAAVCDAADVRLPSTFDQTADRLPPHLARMLERRGTPHQDSTFPFAVTEAQFREAFVAEMGLMAQLDVAVGRMMSAVAESGLADETAIIFTSDHGDLFGDHGLMLKHFVHYEGVTRVPLVIKQPNATPGRSAALVSNADIAPTILDLAGVASARGMQGRSLTPVAADGSVAHRSAVLIEEDQPMGIDGLPAPVRIRTVISDEGRLTMYQGCAFGELYDHHADPQETENRFGDPAAAGLEHRLRDHMIAELMAVSDEGQRIEACA